MVVLTRNLSIRDWEDKVTGWPILVSAPPKISVCSRWLAGIAGSNPVSGKVVYVL
jgi:hypothetical protein